MVMFNSKEYLQKMLVDKQKHIQIIALFAIAKGYKFENKDQIQFLISRNARAAKRLQPFELEKIKKTLNYLLETAEYKVTLETVEKFILEDIKELEGEEPIITLKDGEDVYEIRRTQELEKQGRIKYDTKSNKWHEVGI